MQLNSKVKKMLAAERIEKLTSLRRELVSVNKLLTIDAQRMLNDTYYKAEAAIEQCIVEEAKYLSSTLE